MLSDVEGEYTLKSVDRLSSGMKLLEEEAFDIILLDLGLPDSSGIETFLKIQDQVSDLPVIVLTVLADEKLAAEAMSRGGQDYLVKGRIDGNLLVRSIRYSIERKRSEEQLRRMSRRTELILATAGEGILELDTGGTIIFLNNAAADMFGYTVDELTGKNCRFIYHHSKPDGTPYPIEECPIDAAFRQGADHYGEEVFWRKDGSSFPVDFTSKPLYEENKIVGAVVTFRDITQRKQAEEALRESENLYRTLFNAIDEGFCIIEVIFDENEKPIDYRFLEINPSFEKQTGLSDAQGKRMRELAPKHEEHWFEIYGKIALSGQPARFQNRAEQLHRWYDVYAFRFGQPEDRQVGIIFNDITERKQIEDEVKHMAHHDALTGLPNRRLFRDIMKVELNQANRHRKKMAILFMDLDRFKEVNDTLGHEAGDLLLKEAASRLRAVVRKSDTIARIGGDEFNIILADLVHPEDIADIAKKIIEAFRKPFPILGNQLHITTSIGISIYPDDSDDIDALLRYADIAMYHAKENGRNKHQFYNASINVRSLERMRLESMLHRSLELGEMVIYYQPLVDIATRRIVCAEALARWRHPDKGLLEPKDFIPAAEETGFINEIDEWTLKTACAQVRAWLDSGLPSVCVTVNLSAGQFQDPHLVERVSSILHETRMPPECLDIEITESTAMSSVEGAALRLKQLVKMGIHISIDDFGTGYSSLNHLKRLPIKRLKIDKSFIQDICADPDDRTIVRAVTAMAHNMKMKVVAEGVETEEQLEFLRKTGCDEMQGFLFSEPLPADKFRELVDKR